MYEIYQIFIPKYQGLYNKKKIRKIQKLLFSNHFETKNY